MKITEIHIYGYGKLENFVVKNLADIQVIFGMNEAGKSTIMSFIHSILFGFPTKQQIELRYEPKHHTKYGGKLILLHDKEGEIVVERVKGKATGDVSVKLADGTIGGEELLSKFLKKMDKTMYQSIFSYNLHGLQNIQQLKGEDLGKFLFSTGAVGTDILLKVETELKKQIESRFKPNGKIPTINEKIRETQQLHLKLLTAQKKNDAYSSLVQQRINLEHSIKTLQEEMKHIQFNTTRMEEWKKHFPYVQELKAIKEKLAESHTQHFPIDGMKRFEEAIQMLKPIEAQNIGITSRLEKLEEELEQIKLNDAILKDEAKIETAIASVPLLEQLTIEQLQDEQKLTAIVEKIRTLHEKLNYSLDEEQLLRIDTSIFMKEKITQSQRILFQLQEQKQMLDSRYQEEQTVLLHIEKELELLKEQLLSDEERRNLLEVQNKSMRVDQVKKDLNEVQSKIQFYQENKKLEKESATNSKKQKLFQTGILLFFFVFLAGWSGFNHQWSLLFATSVCFILFTIFSLKTIPKKTKSTLDEAFLKLGQHEKQLLAQIQAVPEETIDKMLFKLQHDEKMREQLSLLQVKYSSQQIRYDQVIESYEKWESEKRNHEAKMKELLQELYLPTRISLDTVCEAFQIISDLKELNAEKVQLEERKDRSTEKQLKMQETIEQLARKYFPEKTATLMETVVALKSLFKETQLNQMQLKTLKQKKHELEVEKESIRKELQFLQTEISKLLSEAKVQNEDEFRSKAKEVMYREIEVQRQEALTKQLDMAGFAVDDYSEYAFISQLNDQTEEWLQLYQQNDRLLADHQNDLAETKYEIAQLEDGGTYTELLHEFKQKKYQLELEAREWGVYATAKHLLTQTIDRYKHEKLPTLLKTAEDYLSYLTFGSYIKIHPKKEGSGFIIEREDRSLFEANELSQATMEQVYVSLRLALATTLFETSKFPIIIDDSFVNFDSKRSERMVHLLSKIQNHQILFFTCHSHLLFHFDEEQIFEVNKKVPMITEA